MMLFPLAFDEVHAVDDTGDRACGLGRARTYIDRLLVHGLPGRAGDQVHGPLLPCAPGPIGDRVALVRKHKTMLGMLIHVWILKFGDGKRRCASAAALS